MKYNIVPALLFISCGLFTVIAQASPLNSSYMLLAQSNQGISQAAKKIKRQTGGRILSTKSVNKKGRMVYKIKVLLPSGKVQTFTVDEK